MIAEAVNLLFDFSFHFLDVSPKYIHGCSIVLLIEAYVVLCENIAGTVS